VSRRSVVPNLFRNSLFKIVINRLNPIQSCYYQFIYMWGLFRNSDTAFVIMEMGVLKLPLVYDAPQFSAVLFVTEESCVTVRAKTVTVRTCFINNLCNRQGLVGWLVGDYLLLRNFGPYGIYYECVFYNRCNCKAVKGFWALCDIFVCIITVVVLMLLRDFEPYGIIFLCVL
jgi:hypothetical protein